MIKSFSTAQAFRKWLTQNHARSSELWLRIFKKDSGVRTITYAEALDEALCFGWIDAIKKSYDAKSWIQRFCKRKPKSNWSKINTQHAKRLIKTGRMRAPGLAAIKEAQKDGRWARAYDSQGNSKLPKDFLALLKKNKNAASFFATLNRANLYAIAYRLQVATNTKTRQARMVRIIKMLEQGKKFH